MGGLYGDDPGSGGGATGDGTGDITFTQPTRWIGVGSAGSLTCDLADGTHLEIPRVGAGLLKIALIKIYAGGTTAADFTGLS